ncbi:uncharacterized protein [Cherax quadricarinatus]
MSCILDFFYNNLAIVKESMLIRFIEVARQLEIECLQTPGLLKLEQNLLATNKFPKISTEMLSNTSQEEELMAHLQSSITCVKLYEKEETEVKSSGNSDRASFSTNSLDNSSEKNKNHCCCCKNSGESSQEKEKKPDKENDSEKETIIKKLKKCGTVISSGGITSTLLDVPAWLFSSTDISLTPVKSHSKNSAPNKSSPLNKKSQNPVPPQSPVSNSDDPIEIYSSHQGHSKFSATHVRRDLQNSYQTPTKQKQVISAPSSSSISDSERGVTPSSFRGQGRQYIGSSIQQSTLVCRTGPLKTSTPDSKRQITRECISNIKRGSLQTRGRPLALNRMTSSRGIGRKGKSILNAVTPVSNTTAPSQGAQRNTIFLNCKEPLEILDSNNFFQLLDNDAEVIQESSDFNIALENKGTIFVTQPQNPHTELESKQEFINTRQDISTLPQNPHAQLGSKQESINTRQDISTLPQNPHAQLGSKQESINTRQDISTLPQNPHTQLESKQESINTGQNISTLSQNPHTQLDSLPGQSEDPQGSDNTKNDISPWPQDQPSVETTANATLTSETLDTKMMPKLNLEPSMIHDFELPDLTKNIYNQKCNNEDKNSSNDAKQPDNADKQESQKPRKKRRRSKRLGRPRVVQMCSVCKKVFSTHSSLIMHMRIHNNENPFYCSSCSYRTELYNNIKQHVSRQHKRSLNKDEGKRHTPPTIDPLQSFEGPAKKKKEDDEKVNDEDSNEEMHKFIKLDKKEDDINSSQEESVVEKEKNGQECDKMKSVEDKKK